MWSLHRPFVCPSLPPASITGRTGRRLGNAVPLKCVTIMAADQSECVLRKRRQNFLMVFDETSVRSIHCSFCLRVQQAIKKKKRVEHYSRCFLLLRNGTFPKTKQNPVSTVVSDFFATLVCVNLLWGTRCYIRSGSIFCELSVTGLFSEGVTWIKKETKTKNIPTNKLLMQTAATGAQASKR